MTIHQKDVIDRRSRCAAYVAVMMAAAGLTDEASAQIRGSGHLSGFSSPVGFLQDQSNPTVQFIVELGGGTDLSGRAGCTGTGNGQISIAITSNIAAPNQPTNARSGTVSIAGEPQALVASETTLSATTGLPFDTVLQQRNAW
jgi:hypothetical protein